MCKENREYLIILLAAFLFCSVWGVLHGEEQPDRWYLMPESLVLRLEAVQQNYETERQNWQLQANALNQKLRVSEKKSAAHELTAIGLNNQLAGQRVTIKSLEESFSKYEADQLILLSSKNGEIAGLEAEKAEKTLEAERYKGGIAPVEWTVG
jgi:hypothetical protein